MNQNVRLFFHRAHKDQHGQMIPIIAFMMVTFLGFAGLVVDVGRGACIVIHPIASEVGREIVDAHGSIVRGREGHGEREGCRAGIPFRAAYVVGDIDGGLVVHDGPRGCRIGEDGVGWVGKADGEGLAALGETVASLGLADAVRMPGSVPDGVLAAHYRAADVFVCLSDHEGFCVPLLEAMHHRLPIVAFASSAVPETLGDAGLCLPDKAPAAVAHAVSLVLGDSHLRAQLARAAEARLRDFDLVRTSATFTEAIVDAVGVAA